MIKYEYTYKFIIVFSITFNEGLSDNLTKLKKFKFFVLCLVIGLFYSTHTYFFTVSHTNFHFVGKL